MPETSPFLQLRERLEIAKRQGYSFEFAWPWAMERVKWPHDTGHRRAAKAALDETRWAWKWAYCELEGDLPGAAGLLWWMESMRDEDDAHDPNPRRTPAPPQVGTAKAA